MLLEFDVLFFDLWCFSEVIVLFKSWLVLLVKNGIFDEVLLVGLE